MPILSKDRLEKFYQDVISIDNFKNGVVNTNNFILKDNNSLLDCLNLDIDDNGKLRTREGYTKIYSGNVSNLFSFKKELYFTEGNYLKKIDENNNVVNLIQINGSLDISYTVINNELVFCNGEIMKVVRLDGTIEDLTTESPKVKPIYSVIDGQLLAGRYLIAFTYSRNGYEYGASFMDVVDITEDGKGILIQAPNRNGYNTNYYISHANGQTMYRSNSYIITSLDKLGNGIQTLNLDSLPIGEQCLYFMGRLYTVVGNTIYYSMSNYYAMCDLTSNFINIDNSNIRMIANVDDGLYISTDIKTYFLRGTNPESFSLIEILPYPCIKGTAFDTWNIKYKIKGFFTEKGLILVDNGGEVKNITQEKFIPNSGYSKGVTFEKRSKGLDNVVVILDKVGDNSIYQTDDFIDNL